MQKASDDDCNLAEQTSWNIEGAMSVDVEVFDTILIEQEL